MGDTDLNTSGVPKGFFVGKCDERNLADRFGQGSAMQGKHLWGLKVSFPTNFCR